MQVLQTQDVLIGQIPEVKDVLGKIGRAESALDPAPAAMIETYVMLKPESKMARRRDPSRCLGRNQQGCDVTRRDARICLATDRGPCRDAAKPASRPPWRFVFTETI